MIVRTLQNVEALGRKVDWGNGTSHRYLVAGDGLGFTICRTICRAGLSTELEYRKHLEACVCISGTGWVTVADGTRHRIEPGTMYALDQHDQHVLTVDGGADLLLVSVFSPALRGDETHDPTRPGASGYE